MLQEEMTKTLKQIERQKASTHRIIFLIYEKYRTEKEDLQNKKFMGRNQQNRDKEKNE